ncbi:uncharacterized protein SPPG_08426 [Spizellomyces punctatus DAOM BR117]|uniref:RIIa domain-containing protein n=1 Tax=Spizellomyces punctatus (strain DAOM BR117) TaxID=645134 RepID=A0A0L0H5M9_SPIPD|nr:uncharacterized protein SPPG_08426 [Spizellomyces punctatus DAOM BR117]KNC96274.1 hypothetical protein SPPG_08426 [Spizellomyces punctatus DAOM BR117]|eukprot:XP_016604314.1 hypothetical protein SPPG_08426 [Spizellomyces punctatus DAOM BR117]
MGTASGSTSAPTARPLSAHVIDAAMQEKLNHDKIQLRIENEHYIRKHPEIKHILDYFMTEVLTHQPSNVQEFAAAVLSDPDLRAKVEKHKIQAQQFDETLGHSDKP